MIVQEPSLRSNHSLQLRAGGVSCGTYSGGRLPSLANSSSPLQGSGRPHAVVDDVSVFGVQHEPMVARMSPTLEATITSLRCRHRQRPPVLSFEPSLTLLARMQSGSSSQ